MSTYNVNVINFEMSKMKLVSYRNKAGLSREKAAQKLGVSLSTVARWEKGISSIPGYAISKIQSVYSLSQQEVIELLSEIETKQNKEGA